MALGLTPARGTWEYRRSAVTTLSQGAFSQGDLVVLDHSRNVSVWTSTYSNYLGIAMGSSANSFPNIGSPQYVLVAIPGAGCTMYADSLTSDVSSNLSLGQSGSIITRYGRTSCLSMQPAGGSAFSFLVTVVGPPDNALSRIEVAFISQGATFYSASSATLNN